MKLINKIKLLVIFALTLIASLCFVACEGNKDNQTEVTVPEFSATVSKEYNTYTDTSDSTLVTLDGTITDAEWASQNKWDTHVTIGGYDHHVEVWSRFANEGVLMAYRVTGAPAFYNAGRGDYANSGIEIYVANGNVTTPNRNQWEMEFFANGDYHTSRWLDTTHPLKDSTQNNYTGCNTYIDLEGRWLDKDGNTTYINNPENNGYEDEVMIPWYVFGGEKCDSIVFNAAIQFMTDDYSPKRSGYVNILDALEGNSYWSACQKWCRFDKNGYYDKTKSTWNVTPYDIGINIDAEEDGMNITGLGWNAGPSVVYNNTKIANTDTLFVTTKLAAPHNAHEEGSAMWNELLAKEQNTKTQANGGTETAYNGLNVKNGSYAFEIAFRKDYGTQLHLRWNGSNWGWTTYVVPTALAEKYVEEGLNLGILVEGQTVKVLLENAEGIMEVIPAMTKTLTQLDSAKGYQAGVYYQCDAKFDNFNIYYGDTMNQSVQIVNETAADAKGTITAQGAIGGNLVVNVTPDEGYELATLMINGVDYAAYANENVVTINNYAYGTAKINATFREEISQSISLSATHKFVYESEAYACNGISIILKDTEGNRYGGMVVNGVATIKVPDGTYTITADNHVDAGTIEIVNGETETTSVVLTRKIFNAVDDTVTATLTGDGESATGATLQTTEKLAQNTMLDDKQWKIANVDFSGKVILVYTLTLGEERPCYATIETNRSINTMNQGQWDQPYFADAPGNEWVVGKNHTGATTFALIYEGTQIVFAEKVDDKFEILYTYNDDPGELTYICFTHGEHAAVITWSDIKVYDGARADAMLANTVTVSDETSDKLNVTVDKTSTQNGDTVTINASVKEGNEDYHLAGITVNGEILEAVEGVYSFKTEGYGKNYVVKATAEKETYALTFNATWRFAYETGAAYAVADGTELKFVSTKVSKAAIVENGQVTVRLSNGTYTCGNTTIVVENGTTAITAVEAIRTVVKSYDKTKLTVTESANGAHVVSKDADEPVLADLDMSNALLVITVAKEAQAGPWTDLLISPYGWEAASGNVSLNGNKGTAGGYRFDFLKVQDGIQLQLGGNALGDYTTRDNGQTSTIVIRTTSNNLTSTSSLYVKHYDDQYTLVGTLSKEVSSISELYYALRINAPNMVYDVKVYDGAAAEAQLAAMDLYEQAAPAAMTIDGVTVSSSSKFVKFEDGAIITNGAFKPNVNFSASEEIVAMTYNVQLLDDKFTGTCDGDGAWINTAGANGIEFIHQDVNKIGYRFRAGNWGRYYFDATQMTAIRSEAGLPMGAYLANGGNIILQNGDGVWYNAKYLDKGSFNATEINGMAIRTAMKLTNIHFYTQETWNAYMASLGGDVNVENGKATVKVNPTGSTVVTVVPNEGYVLDTLKVDGTDVTLQVVNNVYTITNGNENGKFAINVEVSFKVKPAAKYSVKLNAKTNVAYNIGAAYVGSATLTGANGEYTATAAEGVLDFGEVVEGTYTLKIADYADQVVVVEAAVEKDVNLFYVTEGATTVEIVGNDVVYTFSATWQKIILPANTTAVTFKVAIKNYTVPADIDNCGLHVNSDVTGNQDKEFANQAEIWLKNGKYQVRLCWGTAGELSAWQVNQLTSTGLTMKVAIENGTFKLFVANQNGDFDYMLKNDNSNATVLTDIQVRNISGGVVISELIATKTPNGTVIVNDVENATITADKTVIAYGEQSVITVTPAENYVVSAVTVNGKLATMVPGENGAIKAIVKYAYLSYNVNVVVTAAAGTQQIYTVDHKYAYEADAYAIADNTVVSFVGETATYLGVINAGKLTVTAPAGEYTVRLYGHKDQTVTVGDRASLEAGTITLVRSVINETYTGCELDISETETGAKISNTKNQLDNPPMTAIQVGDDITGKTVYTLTLKASELKWGSCPRLWFFDGVDFYSKVLGENLVNIVIADQIYFRPANQTNAQTAIRSAELDIVVIVEGKIVKVYAKAPTADTYTFIQAADSSTEYTLKLDADITRFTIGATDGTLTWDLEDIKAYDGDRVNAALVTLGLATAESAE